MKGGIRKRGLTWSYYFDLGIISDKRKKKEKGGFKTKGEAEKALRNAMAFRITLELGLRRGEYVALNGRISVLRITS